VHIGEPDNWLSIGIDPSRFEGPDAILRIRESPFQVVHMSIASALGTVSNRMSTDPRSQRDAR